MPVRVRPFDLVAAGFGGRVFVAFVLGGARFVFVALASSRGALVLRVVAARFFAAARFGFKIDPRQLVAPQRQTYMRSVASSIGPWTMYW